jgi:hypothetical protein
MPGIVQRFLKQNKKLIIQNLKKMVADPNFPNISGVTATAAIQFFLLNRIFRKFCPITASAVCKAPAGSKELQKYSDVGDHKREDIRCMNVIPSSMWISDIFLL